MSLNSYDNYTTVMLNVIHCLMYCITLPDSHEVSTVSSTPIFRGLSSFYFVFILPICINCPNRTRANYISKLYETAWSIVVFWLSEPPFIEPEHFLPCSQAPATGFFSEPRLYLPPSVSLRTIYLFYHKMWNVNDVQHNFWCI